jgi:hypothetical protein
MDLFYYIIFLGAAFVVLIGFLRIFTIDSSLRQILAILKKQTGDK